MNEIKIQSLVKSFGFQSSPAVKNYAADFQSLLTAEVDSVPEDWADYKAGISFGPDMNFSFPPDNAPAYFKKAWYDVTSQLDFEQRICIFNDDVTSALNWGYYYYMFDRKDGADGYNAMNNRVESLGCVGCLELAIRSAEQAYNDNVRGGNEKKWTDKMKYSLDALKEIMQKCQESGDPSIERQIRLADIDFERSKAKILREAEIWLQANGGDDLQTMSDEKFESLLNRVAPTITRYLPDGTILTINSSDGKILNRLKSDASHAADFLQLP